MLIVDDVITAGTAIREAVGIIEQEGGVVVGIVVALDRGERVGGSGGDGDDGSGDRNGGERKSESESESESGKSSAIGQIRKELGIPVLSVLTLDDVIEGLRESGSGEDLKRLEEYRSRYQATG